MKKILLLASLLPAVVAFAQQYGRKRDEKIGNENLSKADF